MLFQFIYFSGQGHRQLELIPAAQSARGNPPWTRHLPLQGHSHSQPHSDWDSVDSVSHLKCTSCGRKPESLEETHAGRHRETVKTPHSGPSQELVFFPRQYYSERTSNEMLFTYLLQLIFKETKKMKKVKHLIC